MITLLCPAWKQAVAWDLRELGSVWEKGVRPPERGKDKQLMLSKGRTTWRMTRRNNQI